VAVFYRTIRTPRSLAEIGDVIRAKLPGAACTIQAENKLIVDHTTARLELTPLSVTRERVNNLTLELHFEDDAQLTQWNALLDALHEPPKIRFSINHYFASELPLATCCAKIADAFSLPAFELDGENDNDWGFSEDDVAIVHVSRAHRAETFHEWNPKACPPQCNMHVTIDVKVAAPPELDDAWLAREWKPRWIALLIEMSERVFDGERWHQTGESRSEADSSIRKSR
jgi:hypothetical protein